MIHTVAEDELANTGQVHRNAAEEVIRAADTSERYNAKSQ